MKTFDLKSDLRSKVFVVAHRGLVGGNVPPNTPLSFDAAILAGADMVELDVEKSKDGTLYCFHGGNEVPHLMMHLPFKSLHDDVIKTLRYVNQDLAPTQYPIYRLDEVFEHLKGKCYINVDKFQLYPREITECIRRHGIQDQVVVKTDATKELLDIVETYASDINYIAIMEESDVMSDVIKQKNVQYVGVEAVFGSENAPICQNSYIEKMHEDGLAVWGNGIVFNYRRVLSAGHTDDIAVSGNPDYGWGWFLDKGFDLIQTDFACQLRQYVDRYYSVHKRHTWFR